MTIYHIKTQKVRDPKTQKMIDVPAYSFIPFMKGEARPSVDPTAVTMREVNDDQFDIRGQELKFIEEPEILRAQRKERDASGIHGDTQPTRGSESPENRNIPKAPANR